MTWPKIKVIGVSEDDAEAKLIIKLCLAHGLDGALCADRHEAGGLDPIRSVGKKQDTRASAGVLRAVRYFESHGVIYPCATRLSGSISKTFLNCSAASLVLPAARRVSPRFVRASTYFGLIARASCSS